MPTRSHITRLTRFLTAVAIDLPSPVASVGSYVKAADREFETAFSRTAASPALAPNTSPSSSEFDARRFAPCTPVQLTSPAAYSPATVLRPQRSVRIPPMQ